MKRFAITFCILIAFGVGLGVPAFTHAQESPAADPAEGWESLSAEAFITEADRLLGAEQTDEEKAALRDSIDQHASQRLVALNAQSTITRATFLRLFAFGQSKLSREQQEAVSLAVLPPVSEMQAWSFQELRAEHKKEFEARMPTAATQAMVSQWADVRSVKDYSNNVEQMLPTLATRDAEGKETSRDVPATVFVEAIYKHATTKLVSMAPGSSLDVEERFLYFKWGRHRLPGKQWEGIAEIVRPRAAEMTDWTFQQVRQANDDMVDMSMSDLPCIAMFEDWGKERSISDYSQNIEELHSLMPENNKAVRLMVAIRAHAATKALSLTSSSNIGFNERIAYYRLGRHKVKPEQQQRVLEQVSPRTAEMADWTVEQLDETSEELRNLGAPRFVISDMTGRWLETHRDDYLSAENMTRIYRDLDREVGGAYKLEATWTGAVTATAGGNYSFSICPININADMPGEKMFHTVAVWVDGKQVIDSTPENWAPDGGSANLEAGKKADIRFEWTLECEGKGHNHVFPAVAQLLWKGPGISKSVIPSSVLTPPEGEDNGLQGDFRLIREGKQDVLAQRIDPNLNMVWDRRNLFVSPLRSSAVKLASGIHTKAMAPAHLSECELDEEDDGTTHEYFKDISTLEMLTSRQRAEFVGEVLTRPGLLRKAAGDRICELYFAARVGALDAALEMLGKWCQAHPNGETILGTRHSPYRHGWYKEINIGIVWQYAPHHEMLEEQYLEMPDGGCNLTAACILAHSYKDQDRFEQWIEKLETRLADKSLAGDQRVNWLLARAYAEEMRRGRPGRHYVPLVRPLAGRGWIETACLVAQTEPVRLRAYRELMARWLSDSKFDKAREVVATAQARLTSPESAEALSSWTTEIDRLESVVQKECDAYVENANEAYRNKLRERLSRARQRGDDRAVATYEEKLNLTTTEEDGQ